MRSTANQRSDRPGADYTGQQALDKIMSLQDCHGHPFDGQRALVILKIARQHGIKAEALRKGLMRVRPSGSGYTIEIDE